MICEGQQVSQAVLIWLSHLGHALGEAIKSEFCGISTQQSHDVKDSWTGLIIIQCRWAAFRHAC